MHRENFAWQLKKAIDNCTVTQIKLAERLGISSAAISQFVHGTNLPSISTLNEMLVHMQLPQKEEYLLRCCLSLARSEPRRRRISEFNRSFFDMHVNCGLSLEQLSVRIGIPANRLFAMENDPDLEPTQNELKILKDFFGYTPKEYNSKKNTRYEFLESNRVAVPQISLSTLRDFRPGGDDTFASFAYRNAREVVMQPLFGFAEPVLIIANSDRIHFAHSGLVQMLTTAERPKDFLGMELRRYTDGSFFLYQAEISPWRKGLAAPEPEGKIVDLVLPVVQVTLHPMTLRDDDI